MNKLTIKNNIYNDYARAQDLLRSSGSSYYTDDEWKNELHHGRLDMYINAINKSADIDKDTLIKDYALDFANKSDVTKALYNEIYSDKNEIKNRKIAVTDEFGNATLDNDGNAIYKDVEMNDYDYYKQQMYTYNNYKRQKEIDKQNKKSKDSSFKFWKALTTIISPATRLAGGAIKTIDDAAAFINGAKEWIATYLKTHNKTAADNARLEGILDMRNNDLSALENALVDFERKYTYLRDENGDYSSAGEIVGGLFTTLGQMLPGMGVGKVVGGLASAAGASATTAGTLAGATSQLVFYSALDAGMVKETYDQFVQNNCSISSSQILANADIKAVLQWFVEYGLGKALGNSNLDQIVFGRSAKVTPSGLGAIGSSHLGTSGSTRLLHDFLEEGLEEVFQDTSDFLVDRVFMQLIDENYGQLTDLTPKGLLTSFVMGGLASLVGSSLAIMSTKKIQLNTFETDKNGNIVTDKNGNPIFKKLSKLKSWEYGISMQSVLRNFNTLVEIGNKNEFTGESKKQFEAAFMQAYGAVRLLEGVYNEVGEKRFIAVNAILTKIEEGIANGDFNKETIARNNANLLMALNIDDEIFKTKAKNKLEEAKIILRDRAQLASEVSDIKFEAEQLKNVSGAKEVYIVEDSAKTVEIPINKDETVIVSSKSQLKNQSSETILYDLAEQSLIENVVNNISSYGLNNADIDILKAMYKLHTRLDDTNLNQVVAALIFEKTFLKSVLFQGGINIKILSFIAKLDSSINAMFNNNTLAGITKTKRINDSLKNIKAQLVNFFKLMPNIAFENYSISFSKAQIESIKNARYENIVSSKVLNKKISNTELKNTLEIIKKRLTISADNNGNIWLVDKKFTIDEAVSLLERYVNSSEDINKEYVFAIFVATDLISNYYDGIHFPILQSITNRSFINYLEQRNTDMLKFFNEPLLDEEIEYFANKRAVDKNNIIKNNKRDIAVVRSFIFKDSLENNIFGNTYDYELRYDFNDNDDVDLPSVYVHSNFSALSKSNEYALLHSGSGESGLIELGITSKLKYNKKDISIGDTIISKNIAPEIRETLTIDDIIINPSLINKDIIKELYGWNLATNALSRASILNRYIIDNYDNTVIGQDIYGRFVLVNTEAFNNMKSQDFDTKIDSLRMKWRLGIKDISYKIKDLVINKFIPAGYENIEVKFIENLKKQSGVNGITTEKDGRLTIFIDISLDKTELRDTFRHEFDHLCQVASLLSTGAGDILNNLIDKDEFIKDLKEKAPQLVPDKKGLSDEAWEAIINDNIYKAIIGEIYANGNSNYESYSYGTIAAVNINGLFAISTPWGKVYGTNIRSIAIYKLSANKDNEARRFFATEQISLLNGKYNTALTHNTITSNKYVKILPQYTEDNSLYRVIDSDGFNLKVKNVDNDSELNLTQQIVEPATRKNLILNKINVTDFNNRFGKENKDAWLKKLYYNLGGDKQFTFKEFLNTEIPVVFAIKDELNNDNYYGAYIGFLTDRYLSNITYINIDEQFEGNLYIGKIKPTDLKLYAVDSCYNCYISNDMLIDFKTYYADRINGALYINTAYNTINNKSYTIEQIPAANEKETDAYAKEYDKFKYLEAKSGKIKSIEYEYGGASDNYNRRTRVTFADNSSILKDIRYRDGHYKGMYVSSFNAGNTNLSYFSGKTLSPQMQKFILSTHYNKVDKVLQDKIDGTKKGSLTYRDVYNYLRDTSESNFDDDTFKAINKAFYQNEHIKDIHDLDNKVDTVVIAYALGELLKTKDLGEYLNNDYDKVIPKINELINSNKEYASKLQFYQDKFDKEHIDERRLRDLWLRYFDGTVRSAWNIARMSYIAAKRQWNRSDYDVSGRRGTYSGDVETVEGGGTRFDNMADDAKDFVEAIMEAETSQKTRFIATMQVVEALLKLEQNGEKFNGDIIETIELVNSKLLTFEDEDIDNLYTKYSKYKDNPKVKAMLAKYTSAVINEDNVITATENKILEEASRSSYNIVQNIKAYAKKISNAVKNGKIKESLVKDLFNTDGTFDKSLYQNILPNGKVTYKDQETILALEERLRAISHDISADELNAAKAAIYRKQAKIDFEKSMSMKKIELGKNQYADTIDDVTIIFEGQEKEMPKVLEKFTKKQFKEYSSSKARFALDGDPKHFVASANEFFEEYSSFLNNLSQGDAEAIADFFASVKATVIGDQSAFFNASQIYLSMYILKGADGKNPRFVLNDDLKRKLRINNEQIATRAGQILQEYNQAYNHLSPQTRVLKALAKNYGFEVDEKLLTDLNEAVKSGVLDRIQEIKKLLYAEMLASHKGIPQKVIKAMNSISGALKVSDKILLKKLREELFNLLKDNYKSKEKLTDNINNYIKAVANGHGIDKAANKLFKGMITYRKNKQVLNRLLEFQRAAMLSGPGTWIRNQLSDITLFGVNYSADYVGGVVTELLYKLFPKHRSKVADNLDSRYRYFNKVKIPENIKNWIQKNILDTKYYDLINDGINKYTSGQKFTSTNTNIEPLTKLILDSIVTEVFKDTATDSKVLQKVYGLVNKAISDNFYIKKAFVKYLGKLIVTDNIELDKGINSKRMLNAIAQAYSLAATEYMHKPNFINDFEKWLNDKLGGKAYFIYKQVFPFLSASMNWFLEGVRLSPVGLLHSIYKFARLENTIEKAEKNYREGKSAIDPRFTEFIIKRNIGKGIIGTIGWIIGIILRKCKIAGIDEKDDKLKLYVGNLYIDITSMFGTQGILQGMSMMDAIERSKNSDDNGADIFFDVIKNVFDQMFADTTVSDMYNTFRYNNGFADALYGKLFATAGMFIPNMIKYFTFTNKYKVNYEKGILGRMERLLVQAIPSVAYALPSYIDPYTGEKQIAYKWSIGTQWLNKTLPINIYPYNVTETEKLAISLGINKGQLTGEYKINGENVILTKKQGEDINKLYGSLNKKELDNFINNKTTYKVLDKKTNKYVILRYSKMTDAQKASVIDRIMTNNASVSKVYAITKYKDYKYYTNSREEFNALKKLGATNVFIGNDKLKGFVKVN